MKKILLTLAVAMVGYGAYAQFSSSGGNTTTSDNVGIGTASPQGLLNINSGVTPSSSQFRITANGLGSLSALNYSPDNTSIGFDVDYYYSGWVARNSSVASLYKLGGLFRIMGSSENTVGGSATLNDFLDINLSSGNVGIGTTSPGAKLDVGYLLNNGDLGTVLGRLSEGNTTAGGTYLGVKGYATQGSGDIKSFAIEHSFYGSTNNSINFYRGGGVTGGFMTFSTNSNNERMRIDPDGNVDIGTIDSHGYKLAVNGNVIATSMTVKLYADWPDYVFKPSYHLPSLTTVKTYIDKNKHLPDMPSEQQVKDNGINLGEIVKVQTKKIEELTLYAIEQQKQIDELKSQVAKLIKQQ